MGAPLLMRRAPGRWAAAATLAALSYGCNPETTGPGAPEEGALRIRTVLESAIDPALFDLDSVAVVIRRSADAAVVREAVLEYQEGAVLAWVLELEDLPDVLDVEAEVRSGTVPMFEGSETGIDIVEASPATPGTVHDVMLHFVGPGHDATSVEVEPVDSVVPFDATVQFRATVRDAAGAEIPGAFLVWQSSAPALAPVDGNGLLTAPAQRGGVEVTATAGNGTAGSAGVSFQPGVGQLLVLEGNGASAPVAGTVLVRAQVLGTDGLPLEGVLVSFQSLTGATLSATSVASAADGIASTVVTLPTAPGSYLITVSTAGTPAQLVAVQAVPGPAASLSIDLAGSTATAGSPLDPGVTVTVLDAYGNVSQDDVEITLALGSNPVGAALSGSTMATTSAGRADFPNLVIDRAGSGFTLVASATGLPSVVSAPFIVDPAPGTVVSVEVTPGARTLTAIDATEALSAVARDGTGTELTGQSFAWTSSDEGVATVDASGVVTAVRNGTALIRATSGGVTGESTVLVAQDPDHIVVTPPTSQLDALGVQVQLGATVLDANGYEVEGFSGTVTWTSSASGTASVDAAGLVTAVGNGASQVQASTQGASGLASGTASIGVQQIAASVGVSPPAGSFSALGQQLQLVAEAFDANGFPIVGAPVAWMSDASAVAAVDGAGLVTAAGNGATTVRAMSSGVTGTASISVAQAVATVSVDPPSSTLAALQADVQLSAAAFDANGYEVSGISFAWTSSDAGVVSVGGSGLATAEANGSATITASSGGIDGAASVTVAQVVASVVVSPPVGAFTALDEQLQLVAEAFDANGFEIVGASFVWMSDASAVAAVDGAGLVTAAGNGTTTVRAMSAGVTGTASISVAQDVATVEVDPPTSTLAALQAQVQLSATAYDANGHVVTGAAFTWSSAASATVSVDAAGLATAESNGAAEIRASTGGVSGSATVSVTQVATAITVTPSTATLTALDETVALSATIVDANGFTVAGQGVVWASAASATVSVDAGGVASAVSNGSTTVSAISGALIGSATITVAQAVAAVVVSPSTGTFTALDQQLQLVAEAFDANGFLIVGAPFVWMSDASGVADVDGTGLVTANGNGATTVRAMSAGVTGTAALSVAQAVASVEVDPPTSALAALQAQAQLSATAYDANGYQVAGTAFTWSSDAGSVASVDATGLVTAESNGSAQIEATAGTISGTAAVTVSQVVTTVSLTPGSGAFTALQDQLQLAAQALDANGFEVAGATFAWSSDATTVVTVDPFGLVTSTGNGATTVRATSGPAVGMAAMSVAQAVATVEVTPPTSTLSALQEQVQLSAVAYDTNGYAVTGAGFTWSSSETGVATVDGAGLVTAEANGSAQIEATSSGVSGAAGITVAQVATDVIVSPSSATLTALDATVQLAASVVDANGVSIPGQAIVWSAPTGAVTVDAGGTVTAVENGSATVTAASGGLSGTATITVAQLIATIDLTATCQASTCGTLRSLGEQAVVTADARDANGYPVANAAITWTSLDPAVAVVDGSGVVTAADNGTATIQAEGDGVVAQIDIVVRQEVVALSVVPSRVTLAIGEQAQLTALPVDANGFLVTDALVSWSPRSGEIASVSDTGLVTARAAGVMEVRATYSTLVAIAVVTVSAD